MCGADEGNCLLTLGSRKVAIPLLTLLADIDGVKKIGARVSDAFVTDGAEVRDGNMLDGRLLQEKVADGSVRGVGKAFQLLEGWARLAALPGIKMRKAVGERSAVEPGPLSRPA